MGSGWILRRLAWGCELESTGSGQGPVAGCCECGDESSGSCATKLVSFSIVLSCTGRGLCNGLITLPKESYNVF
jgi:hypothetical protein